MPIRKYLAGALFGLTNHIIDQGQYTVLLTAVIGSAVVPALTSVLPLEADMPLRNQRVRFMPVADI